MALEVVETDRLEHDFLVVLNCSTQCHNANACLEGKQSGAVVGASFRKDSDAVVVFKGFPNRFEKRSLVHFRLNLVRLLTEILLPDLLFALELELRVGNHLADHQLREALDQDHVPRVGLGCELSVLSDQLARAHR